MTKISLKNFLLSGALAFALVLSPAAALSAEAMPFHTSHPTAALSSSATLTAKASGALSGNISERNADEVTCSVTFYHYEIVYYDDPSYVQPEAPELAGMRLIGTQTVDDLKVGDRLNIRDYIGTHPGFTFFDGWPSEIVVSEDPAKNAFQLNYIRNSNAVTLNYYHAAVLNEHNEADIAQEKEVLVVPVNNVPVQFTKLGSDVREGELFAKMLSGNDIAPSIEGLQYVGSWPEEVFVSMDPTLNEINLVYGTAAHQPDDSLVEDDAVALPDDIFAGIESAEGTGDTSADNAGNNGTGSSASGGTGNAGVGGTETDGADGTDGGTETEVIGAPSDRNDTAEASPDANWETQISDNAKPTEAEATSFAPIPQTGDNGAFLFAALGIVATSTAVMVAFARHRSRVS